MDFNRQNIFQATTAKKTVVWDEGLRSYMIRVYNYMTTGLILTGIMAYLFGKASVVSDEAGQLIELTPLGATLFNSPIKWIIMLAPLGFVIYLSSRMHKMSLSKAQVTFWIYSAIMGLSLSWIFIVFTQISIVRVFFISSATFAAMSLYGYTTKRDLTKLGSFLMMGLIGIIIASIVNIFMKSSMMYFVISIIGVLVFTGLTAYDVQKIKNIGNQIQEGSESAQKLMIMGALTLYLDFINLFLMMLRLFGSRD